MAELLQLTMSRDDVALAQHVASRRWPLGWHPGGLGWWLRRRDAGGPIVGVLRGDAPTELAGFAVLGVHEDTDAMVLAEGAAALSDLVGWCRARSASRVQAHLRDASLHAVLRAGGYRRDLERAPESGLFLGAAEVASSEPDVPDGYRVRPVGDHELEARVTCHRAAWRPADLPLLQRSEPADPEATSSFTLETYAAVRDTWGYRSSLDLVVEAPDGALAGCCIAWLDDASGVAEIEPLGVVPAHRGSRLASALCREAARRVAALGGSTVFINTEPRAEYPAPGRAYLYAGFRPVPRFVDYILA